MLYRLIKFTLLFFVFLAITIFSALLIQNSQWKTVVSEGLDSRLIPGAVNTQNALSEILDIGVRSMEVDVFFVPGNETGNLKLAHSKKDISDVSLEENMLVAGKHHLKKIWLDIKNLGKNNSDNLLASLENLDRLYNIKKYAIIETWSQGEELRAFSNAGFHTSYYLPTGPIRKLLKEDSQPAMKQEAGRIAELVKKQRFSAVSFHVDLYPFVKTYLEPLLDEHIVYHTWDSAGLYLPISLHRLKESPFYKDKRVKTIIYNYKFIPAFG